MENWGFRGQAHSNSLAMANENFILEVGLYGSPLAWSYKDFSNLATDFTWFKNLRQLVDIFQANLTFQDKDLLHGAWENDCSLMSEFH